MAPLEVGGLSFGPQQKQQNMAVVVETVLVDTILVGLGEFTTHFRFPSLVVGLGWF